MIGRRPQPPRRRLESRFALPPGAERHRRRAGEPRSERLILVRPFRPLVSPAGGTTVRTTTVANRISLVLAPRIEIDVDARTSVAAARPASRVEPRPTAILTTRVERLVRQVERHATRIERSERVVALPAERPGSPAFAAARSSPTFEPAPRLSPVRRPEAPPHDVPAEAPGRSAAPSRELAFRWPPPDPASLADGVLRELDRRIVAERERRGGLA